MKLILHDTLTELRHWRWLVVLWWAIVFIDLGYQCEWWWDGPGYTDSGAKSWTPADEMHGNISSLIPTILWGGLSASALFLFLAISPARTASSLLVQPMSNRSRILARSLWLAVFVGLPWFLHEWIYVRQMADASTSIALLAVFERSLLTLNLWFGIGVLGWCSGTIWNALKICVVGVGSVAGMVLLLESMPSVSGKFESFSNSQFSAGWKWANFSLILVPAIGILVCYQLSFRSGLSTPVRKWLPIILSSILVLPVYFTTVGVVEKIAKQLATNDQWVRKDLVEWQPEISRSQSSFVPSSDSLSNSVWNLVPSYKGLPSTAYSEPARVEGHLTTSDGRISRNLAFVNQHFFSSRMGNHAQWLRHLFREFPKATIFTPELSLPVTDGQTIVLAGHGGENSGMPFEGPTEVSADLKLDLWEMGGAHQLPVDGKPKNAGSLRGARVHSIGRTENEIVIYLRHFKSSSFLNLPAAIDPYRLFALWNSETGEMVKMAEDSSPQTINGNFSHLRLEEKRLLINDYRGRIDENSTVTGDFLTREWIKKSKLVIIEAKFSGSLDRKISVENESLRRATPVRIEYFSLRSLPEKSQESSSVWGNPESSEAEIRRAAYELLSFQKSGKWEVATAPEHIPFLRRLALDFPQLLSRFAAVWREEDREWFLNELEASEEPPEELVRFASGEGWLKNRKNWLAKMIAKGDFLGSDSNLERAVELGVPGALEMQFRGRLYQQDVAVDRTEFPELWENEKTRLWKAWEKEEWQLQIAGAFSIEGISLARMGEPAPLRKLLEGFLKIGKADRDKKYPGVVPFRSRWEWLSSVFDPAETKEADSPEKKVAAVERWLASEWEYQPETMTYRILE